MGAPGITFNVCLLSTIQWVTSGHLLALVLMLLMNGWLVDRIGAKRLYVWCFATFTMSSALCGAAWSAESLVEFRVLQGMSLCSIRMIPIFRCVRTASASEEAGSACQQESVSVSQ